MTERRTITREDIAALLAPSLGQEKADDVVMQMARALGYPGRAFDAQETRAIFVRLGEHEGLVGVVARFALQRGDVEVLIDKVPPSVRAKPPPSARPEPVDLLPLLAPALGVEKARDATAQAAQKHGLDPRALDREGAAAVLDTLVETEGIVGVVARFAKARFLLGKP